MLSAVPVMKARWKDFGNVSNPALEQGWRMMAEAFQETIERNRNPFKPARWYAVPCVTGSGKSQMAITTAAAYGKAPIEEQPGVLIVQRLIEDTEETARQINELAGEKTAAAYHSDSKGKLPLESLREYPTLVITHAALIIALEQISSGVDSPKWEHFISFREEGTRKLVIVDEEISLVSESALSVNDIDRLLFLIEDGLEEQFPEETEGLRSIQATLHSIKKATDGQTFPDMTFFHQPLPESRGRKVDLMDLRTALRAKSFYARLGHNDPLTEQQRHDEADAILGSIRGITTSHLWASRINGEVSLLSSRLILPEDISATVLDATCQHDVRYELYQGIELLKPPSGARRYDNVKLFIGRSRATGKTFMVEHAKDQCAKLMADLERRFQGQDRDVFVVVHKGVRPQLSLILAQGFTRHIGHFGEINGSNAFRDADTCVIMGLPYKPPHWATQQCLALIGSQPTEWHGPNGDRQWGQYADIKKAVNEGVIIADLIQAVNRIRVRKVSDELGNCPSASLYVLLPHGDIGDTLGRKLTAAMPGVQVEEWDFDTGTGKKKKVQRTEHETALMETFGCMKVGGVSAATVKNELGIPSTTFKRYLQRIGERNPDDPLIRAMEENCVSFQTGGRGRGKRSYFVKSY